MSVEILGIRVDTFDREKALVKIGSFLNSKQQYLVFTPNPEMAVKAASDDIFKQTLNDGSLNICDGIGFVLAAKMKKKKLYRITGVDFMMEICKYAEKMGNSIFLLGSDNEEVIKKAAANLLSNFPDLKIAGCHPGIKVEESSVGELVLNEEENERMIRFINSRSPQILFVAFGMGKQEKWLKENLEKMPSVKIGMGVGGAFDYISGKVPRAPLLMRQFGLEWAYRLWKQPKRLMRMYNATIKFSVLNLLSK